MNITEIIGGDKDMPTYSPQHIADKHKVPVADIDSELQKGIKVEQEHTKDVGIATEIALDPLWEVPDYYTRLQTVEKD